MEPDVTDERYFPLAQSPMNHAKRMLVRWLLGGATVCLVVGLFLMMSASSKADDSQASEIGCQVVDGSGCASSTPANYAPGYIAFGMGAVVALFATVTFAGISDEPSRS